MDLSLPVQGSAARPRREIEIVDHRGAQLRKRRASDTLPDRIRFVVQPENTMAAIRDSFEQGHNVELDVNTNGADSFERNGQTVALNGQPLPFLPVYHDDGLENPFAPTDGTPPGVLLRNARTETILGAAFQRATFIKRIVKKILGTAPEMRPDHSESIVHLDESPDATRVPTLDEVLGLLRQFPERHLYIELKTLTQGAEEDMEGLEEKTLHLIKAFGVATQVTVISFNRYALERVRALADRMGLPSLTTAWDIEPGSYLNKKGSREEALSWAKRHVDGILPAHEEVDPGLVEAAHRHGLRILSWPSGKDNRDYELQRIPELIRMGVDGIITNIPSEVDEIVAAAS